MKFDVSHRTTYSYRLPVAQSCHVLHLKPRVARWQTPVSHNLLINPAPATQSEIVDYFGNAAVLLRVEEEHHELVVHSRSAVEVAAAPAFDLEATSPWEEVARMSAGMGLARRGNALNDVDVLQFACRSRHTPITRDIALFAMRYFTPRRPILSAAMDLASSMFRDFKFDPEATDVSTPVLRVLETRRGVCQDFAHLSIAALRSLGLPARYVSGYLLTRPPPGQAKLQGADASHAWLSVWAPETGWVDFDPTNGVVPSGEHITVAWGRDYEDVCPIGGVLLGGGDQKMTVAVDVEPAV